MEKTKGLAAKRYIAKLKEAETSEFFNIFVYGNSRVGKTHLIGSGAEDERIYPILVLDFEGGSSTLAGLSSDHIMIDTITTWKDFDAAYQFLASSDNFFKTVAVDSLSAVHTLAIITAQMLDITLNDKREKRTGGIDYTLEQSDYGNALLELRKTLIGFRALKMHKVFTALAKEATRPGGKIMLPSMYGKMADEIVGEFDIATYLHIVKTKMDKGRYKRERTLTLHSSLDARTGVRTRWGQTLPSKIIDPTLPILFDLLEGKTE